MWEISMDNFLPKLFDIGLDFAAGSVRIILVDFDPSRIRLRIRKRKFCPSFGFGIESRDARS